MNVKEISLEQIKILEKIDDPTIEEIIKISNHLNVDPFALTNYFIERESNNLNTQKLLNKKKHK